MQWKVASHGCVGKIAKLMHNLIRHGRWILPAFVLSQSYIWAAYLPINGPAPLRFQAAPRVLTTPAPRVPLPDIIHPEKAVPSNIPLVLSPDFWSSLLPGLWPPILEQTNEEPVLVKNTQPEPPAGEGNPKNDSGVYLQNLVPFFYPSQTANPTNAGAGHSPAIILAPVDFVPPTSGNRPSSSATYISH